MQRMDRQLENCLIKSCVELTDEQEPILASAIHAGHWMPSVLLSSCGISEADRLREEDPFTENFAAPYANQLLVQTSRFAVDLNRKRKDAVYQKPEDCWGLPVRKKPLSEDLLRQLYEAYDGWYGLAEYTVRRLLLHHPLLLVLDLHSYNHRRNGANAAPAPQKNNPDIIIGRSNLPQKYYPWVEALREKIDGKQIRERVIDCRCDVKFPGGNFVRHLHNTFPNRVIALAIEFKKIFMDEWTGELDVSYQTALADLLAEAVRFCLPLLSKF